MKKFFTKIKEWIGKHKGLTIFLCILIVLAVLIAMVVSNVQKAMAQLGSMTSQTDTVAKRDITSSINATGTIKSGDSRTYTATLSGVDISSVDVEVGDIVAAGDKLCTFDVSDIEYNLDNAKESLYAAQAQNNLSVESAERGVEEARVTRDYQLSAAENDVDNSRGDYETAKSDYDRAAKELRAKAARAAYEPIKNDYAKADADYAKAQNDLTAASAELANLKAAYDAVYDASGNLLPGKADDDGAIKTAYETGAAAVAQKEIDLNTAKGALFSLKTTYDTYASAKANYDRAAGEQSSLESAAAAKENAADSAYKRYQSSLSSYDSTVANQKSNVMARKDSLENAKISAGVGTQQQESQVRSYNQQLEKGVLTALTGGTVTAVNVKEGDRYSGGTIVTIEDCDAFVVSANIDEYDISDVKVGMRAVFKTDATRDEQLEGKVIFVSPTPTASTTGSATYEIKISVDSKTDRLRLGMTAKLNIILTELKNVLTVPYDAIQTDETGNTVIYVLESAVPGQSGTVPAGMNMPSAQRAIPVTVGVEGDYYVEVSGEGLTEGMTVVIPQSISSFEDMMMNAGGGPAMMVG